MGHPRVEEVAKDYCDALLAMHECRDLGDTGRWNALVDRMQAAQLELRKTPEGRDVITTLINHDCVTVRQWSATNALDWAPDEALSELEREVALDGPGSFDAEVTLREFVAGRLDTEWSPRT